MLGVKVNNMFVQCVHLSLLDIFLNIPQLATLYTLKQKHRLVIAATQVSLLSIMLKLHTQDNLLFVSIPLALLSYHIAEEPIPNTVNGPIRLWRNGATSLSYTSGRVQIYFNNMWGNICDDAAFGLTEAIVICHQLGYTGASSQSRAGLDR